MNIMDIFPLSRANNGYCAMLTKLPQDEFNPEETNVSKGSVPLFVNLSKPTSSKSIKTKHSEYQVYLSSSRVM